MDEINVKEVSRRIKAAGIKEEWEVYRRLAGGNHAAAFMLRRCVVWSSGRKVQNKGGWFYKSDVDWQQETGLSRRLLKKSKEILQKIGLTADVRKVDVPQKYFIGKSVNHYRLEPEAFYAALDEALAVMTAQNVQPETSEMSIDDCTERTSADVQNEQQVMYEADAIHCTEGTADDVQSGHFNSSLKDRSESSDQNSILEVNLWDERDFLRQFENQFADFENSKIDLITEVRRLGRWRFGEIVKRCAGRGVTWAYVLKSLLNEAAVAHPPSSALPPSNEDFWADGQRYIQGLYADFITS
jgi:hypothetical protein